MMMENVKESSKAVQQKNSLNALIHWLDLHLEETFLVVMLVLIAGVTMLQVIVRKIPGMASLTWAEGNPTIAKEGRPSLTSASTWISRTSIP